MSFAVAISRFNPEMVDLHDEGGKLVKSTHRLIVKLFTDEAGPPQPQFVQISVHVAGAMLAGQDDGSGGNPNARWYGTDATGSYRSVPPMWVVASPLYVFLMPGFVSEPAAMGRLEPPLPPLPSGFASWTAESTDIILWAVADDSLSPADVKLSAWIAWGSAVVQASSAV
jgi:hypothetical protein